MRVNGLIISNYYDIIVSKSLSEVRYSIVAIVILITKIWLNYLQ